MTDSTDTAAPFPAHPDPSRCSAEETEAVIKWFATLPLRELRHRQDLCDAQTEMAYQQNNDRALVELQATSRLLAAAVGLREFGSLQQYDGSHVDKPSGGLVDVSTAAQRWTS